MKEKMDCYVGEGRLLETFEIGSWGSVGPTLLFSMRFEFTMMLLRALLDLSEGFRLGNLFTLQKS